jgi:hypothetical protein
MKKIIQGVLPILLVVTLAAGCATSPGHDPGAGERMREDKIRYHENEAKQLDEMGMEWQAQIHKDEIKKLNEEKFKNDSFIDIIFDIIFN